MINQSLRDGIFAVLTLLCLVLAIVAIPVHAAVKFLCLSALMYSIWHKHLPVLSARNGKTIDRPRHVVITAAPQCDIAKDTGTPTCQVTVRIEYCHTQIINNTPITFCYWTTQTVTGLYNEQTGCCEVTLNDIDGRTYCVRPGSTITIGPIFTTRGKTRVVGGR
jgi:hypothetical protein